MLILDKLTRFIFGNGEPKADPIVSFKEETNVHSNHLDRSMGHLKDEVTPEQFAEFCTYFAKGVDYVNKKYGTEPDAILLEDSDKHSPCFNIDSNSIRVPRNFVRNLIKTGDVRQSKTEPFILNANDMAMMYAVEEAYHVYQHKQDPTRFEVLFAKQTVSPGEAHYDQQPIEQEAMRAVHQAMQDLGVIDRAKRAQAHVEPKDARWTESITMGREELATLSV